MNDLKLATAVECSEIMSDLCDKILKTNKENTILISKVLPKLESRKINQNIKKFNLELEDKFIDNERVSFCSNDNFSKQGEVSKCLYKGGKDTVHLNEEGTKLLCRNILTQTKWH